MNYCETCKHWGERGFCSSSKIEDGDRYPLEKAADMLLYSYPEGGVFRVGPRFGCVHHEPKLCGHHPV